MIWAVRSQDNRYQYQFTYRWADGPMCGFILLNPSRMEVGADDNPRNVRLGATGQRCVNFALAWGYHGVVIRNRFAYRATHPDELNLAKDPVGPENLNYLSKAADDPITIMAWGSSKIVDIAPPLPGRYPLMCIGKNHNGSPRHVLHAPALAEPRPWP